MKAIRQIEIVGPDESHGSDHAHLTDLKGYPMLEKFIALTLIGRNEEKGATAVEYGLLVALIAAVIIATVVLLGTQINTAFTSITDKL